MKNFKLFLEETDWSGEGPIKVDMIVTVDYDKKSDYRVKGKVLKIKGKKYEVKYRDARENKQIEWFDQRDISTVKDYYKKDVDKQIAKVDKEISKTLKSRHKSNMR